MISCAWGDSLRSIVIVLDSLGIGALPDAAEYGDLDSDTFGHIAKKCAPNLPNLKRLGLYAAAAGLSRPEGAYARLFEESCGKDTITGHLELMGLITRTPPKTYPHGFPPEVIKRLTDAFGVDILGNTAASGTEIIVRLGDEHVATGMPIVYTSADSVLQIAAHEGVISPSRLYDMCQSARGIMTGDYAIGRIIARPFDGEPGHYARTPNRRDYALEPQGDTLLDLLSASGKDVIAVGKIEDIFCGRGITRSLHTHSNGEGTKATIDLLKEDFDGLLFVNLVDFDMLYGHRNDAFGYARALEAFDDALNEILPLIYGDDLLIITADHGCDPTTDSTDHSREYVPALFYGDALPGDRGVLPMSDIARILRKRHLGGNS